MCSCPGRRGGRSGHENFSEKVLDKRYLWDILAIGICLTAYSGCLVWVVSCQKRQRRGMNRMNAWVFSHSGICDSELRSTSDFGCVAVRRWLDRRSFHKRLLCRELAHMSCRLHHEIECCRRSREVRTRHETSRDVATSLKRAIYATAPAFSRPGSGTGTDDALRTFRMPACPPVEGPLRVAGVCCGRLRRRRRSANGKRRSRLRFRTCPARPTRSADSPCARWVPKACRDD